MRLPRALLIASLVVCAAACGASKSDSDSGPGFTPTTIAPPRASFTQVDLVTGAGATANSGNRITVAYSGFLFDPAQPENKGKPFDSNSAYTFTVGIGQVIKGWDQGVPGMRVGGQRRLTIPPELAYGNQIVGSIPANSTLVFDIRLISVG